MRTTGLRSSRPPFASLGIFVVWLLIGSQLVSAQSGESFLEEAGYPELVSVWRDARELEREARQFEREQPELAIEQYIKACRAYKRIVTDVPDYPQAYWRAARALWTAADTLPLEERGERLQLFEEADLLAASGLAIDPDCAECMLWRFAALGRIATTRGIWTSIRQVKAMAGLLERGISLQPTYADDIGGSTLGNLHYSSAIFYRVLPDWFFIGWFLGARGDKDRALDHIRSALALHPERLDYRLELGSQLLCLGVVRENAELLSEGRSVIFEAIDQTPETQDDDRDVAAATIMLRDSAKSCGYAGDIWIEIDRSEALRTERQ